MTYRNSMSRNFEDGLLMRFNNDFAKIIYCNISDGLISRKVDTYKVCAIGRLKGLRRLNGLNGMKATKWCDKHFSVRAKFW